MMFGYECNDILIEDGICKGVFISKGNEHLQIDADKIVGRLRMSSRCEGDTFYSKKRNNTKTLKKLFNEAKIPSCERNNVAILRDDKNIIWIDGFGTDGGI
jgi:tRNA(Ile)-lysidine synthetase-like protein